MNFEKAGLHFSSLAIQYNRKSLRNARSNEIHSVPTQRPTLFLFLRLRLFFYNYFSFSRFFNFF